MKNLFLLVVFLLFPIFVQAENDIISPKTKITNVSALIGNTGPHFVISLLTPKTCTASNIKIPLKSVVAYQRIPPSPWECGECDGRTGWDYFYCYTACINRIE